MENADTARAQPIKRLHPGPIRVMHWFNAIMIFIMIGSPLFTLWYYSRLDDKARERVSSYFHRDS